MADPDRAARGRCRYVAMGRYAEQVGRYRARFPAEDILILDYADMGRGLHGFLNRICLCLDIRPFERDVTTALTGQRHWVGSVRPVTPEEQATIQCLKSYYAPHNGVLFDLLQRRFDW